MIRTVDQSGALSGSSKRYSVGSFLNQFDIFSVDIDRQNESTLKVAVTIDQNEGKKNHF